MNTALKNKGQTMNNSLLNSCKLFLRASKRVLKLYPELTGPGLCYTINEAVKHQEKMPFTIIKLLMKEHAKVYLSGISKPYKFSDHRLYFLLFIIQLTPEELYDMIEKYYERY